MQLVGPLALNGLCYYHLINFFLWIYVGISYIPFIHGSRDFILYVFLSFMDLWILYTVFLIFMDLWILYVFLLFMDLGILYTVFLLFMDLGISYVFLLFMDLGIFYVPFIYGFRDFIYSFYLWI